MASETVTSAPAIDWKDFDDKHVFDETHTKAVAGECENFVLEFGPNNARVVRDLKQDHFKAMLGGHQRDAKYPIRWINIWETSRSKDIVEVIGDKYAFSKRLKSLMKNDKYEQEVTKQGRKKKSAASGNKNPSTLNLEGPVVQGKQDASPLPQGEEIELFLLLKNTVNYFSIDHTEKGTYYSTNFLPPKHWLWLVLCDDHTVITLNESPDLEAAPKELDAGRWKQDQLRNMRQNSLDVLIQQSTHGMSLYENLPLSQNSIRQAWSDALQRSGKAELGRVNSDFAPIESNPTSTPEDDATSSLFYYLFEDYSAAGPLKEAGRILEDLSPKVLGSAERKSRVKSRDIIKPLHLLSKDLRTLKHLFENYMIVIGKIITATRRPGSAPSLDHLGTSILINSESNLSESMLMGADPQRKVFLTASALQRFDRLRDRLKGVMLNTIEGHFEEINALQGTYFNLTQQKDSTATARLTRSATLLAKLSVFFLPVGFITAFFSIQIEDMYIQWTASTYWITFGITIGVSFLSLTFFGRMLMFFSDVLDEWSDAFSGRIRSVWGGGNDDDDDE
ncbi:hypothetical protein PFICI_01363 [Pestalotiopsis fici W106-1]|uniref:ADP-ribosylation factor n=1 Tax=Pestalotiopsis fici (strain W106-1 / CGMCC3.15140) TaxID=1229662 RepID=W3XNK5_PESFW|nr:uncharacterized protein PFICI_01363 [Pestalotiopsis fici W106-1]ETS87535.1 hypothetical protein PFICI_01363 [Pestalotiopsis fici W106-1]